MPDPSLAGRVILVAEDEYLIAADLARELAQAGATVLGPVATVADAADLVRNSPRIDAAILDINLSGEAVFPVADLLRERSVPVLFATGYDRSMMPARFGQDPRCEKPVAPAAIVQALATVAGRSCPSATCANDPIEALDE